MQCIFSRTLEIRVLHRYPDRQWGDYAPSALDHIGPGAAAQLILHAASRHTAHGNHAQ
jgi:hypothetical protein